MAMAEKGGLKWTSDEQVQDFQFRELRKVTFGDPNMEGRDDQRLALLCTSNLYGLTFVGGRTGIDVFQTGRLYEVDRDESLGKKKVNADKSKLNHTHIPTPAPPTHVSLSGDNLTLSVVVREGGAVRLYFYDVRALATKDRGVESFCNIALTTDPAARLCDLQWNPSLEYPNLLVVVLSSGVVSVLDIKEDVSVLVKRDGLQANCVCWSPKGKQFALGMKNGDVVQCSPKNFEEKRRYPPPPKMDSDDKPVQVADLRWLSTFEFAAAYVPQDPTAATSYLAFLSTPKDGPISYNCTEDPYGYIAIDTANKKVDKFHFGYIPNWGVLITCSNNAMDTPCYGREGGGHTVIGDGSRGSPGDYEGPWWQWELDEGGRVEPPLHSDDSETHAVGVAIDYTSQEVVQISDTLTLPCSPLFLMLTNRGVLCSYTIINTACSHDKITELITPSKPLPSTPVRKSKGTAQPTQPAAASQALPKATAPQISAPLSSLGGLPKTTLGPASQTSTTGQIPLLAGMKLPTGGGLLAAGVGGVAATGAQKSLFGTGALQAVQTDTMLGQANARTDILSGLSNQPTGAGILSGQPPKVSAGTGLLSGLLTQPPQASTGTGLLSGQPPQASTGFTPVGLGQPGGGLFSLKSNPTASLTEQTTTGPAGGLGSSLLTGRLPGGIKTDTHSSTSIAKPSSGFTLSSIAAGGLQHPSSIQKPPEPAKTLPLGAPTLSLTSQTAASVPPSTATPTLGLGGPPPYGHAQKPPFTVPGPTAPSSKGLDLTKAGPSAPGPGLLSITPQVAASTQAQKPQLGWPSASTPLGVAKPFSASAGGGLSLGGTSGLLKTGPLASSTVTGPKPSQPPSTGPISHPPPPAAQPPSSQSGPPAYQTKLPESTAAALNIAHSKPVVTMTPATPRAAQPHTQTKVSTAKGADAMDGGVNQEQIEKRFAAHIEQEIDNFVDELDSLQDEMRELVSVDNGGYVQRLGSLQDLTEFSMDTSALRRTMQETASNFKAVDGCSDYVKEETLRGFEVYEEARSNADRKNDPKYASLLKVRPLDSYSTRRLNNMRASFLQVSRAIDEVNSQLDAQLEKKHEERRQRGKNLLKAPSIQTVYSTLRDQHRIIRLQNDCMLAIIRDMKKLRLIPKAWQPAKIEVSPRKPDVAPLQTTPQHGGRQISPQRVTPSKRGQEGTPSRAVGGEKLERLRECLYSLEKTPVKKVARAPPFRLDLDAASSTQRSDTPISSEYTQESHDSPDAPSLQNGHIPQYLTPQQPQRLQVQAAVGTQTSLDLSRQLQSPSGSSVGSFKPQVMVSPDRKMAVRTKQGYVEVSQTSTPQLSRRSSGPDLILSADKAISYKDNGRYTEEPATTQTGHTISGPSHMTREPGHVISGSSQMTKGPGCMTTGMTMKPGVMMPGADHMTKGPGHMTTPPRSSAPGHHATGGTIHWGSPPTKADTPAQTKVTVCLPSTLAPSSKITPPTATPPLGKMPVFGSPVTLNMSSGPSLTMRPPGQAPLIQQIRPAPNQTPPLGAPLTRPPPNQMAPLLVRPPVHQTSPQGPSPTTTTTPSSQAPSTKGGVDIGGGLRRTEPHSDLSQIKPPSDTKDSGLLPNTSLSVPNIAPNKTAGDIPGGLESKCASLAQLGATSSEQPTTTSSAPASKPPEKTTASFASIFSTKTLPSLSTLSTTAPSTQPFKAPTPLTSNALPVSQPLQVSSLGALTFPFTAGAGKTSASTAPAQSTGTATTSAQKPMFSLGGEGSFTFSLGSGGTPKSPVTLDSKGPSQQFGLGGPSPSGLLFGAKPTDNSKAKNNKPQTNAEATATKDPSSLLENKKEAASDSDPSKGIEETDKTQDNDSKESSTEPGPIAMPTAQTQKAEQETEASKSETKQATTQEPQITPFTAPTAQPSTPASVAASLPSSVPGTSTVLAATLQSSAIPATTVNFAQNSGPTTSTPAPVSTTSESSISITPSLVTTAAGLTVSSTITSSVPAIGSVTSSVTTAPVILSSSSLSSAATTSSVLASGLQSSVLTSGLGGLGSTTSGPVQADAVGGEESANNGDDAMMGDEEEPIDDSTGQNTTSFPASSAGGGIQLQGFGLGRAPPTNVTANPFGTPTPSIVTSPSSHTGLLRPSVFGSSLGQTSQPSASPVSMFGSGTGMGTQSPPSGQGLFGQTAAFGSPPSLGDPASVAIHGKIFGSGGAGNTGGGAHFGATQASGSSLSFGGLAGMGSGAGGTTGTGFSGLAGGTGASGTGMGGGQGNFAGKNFSGWR